MKVGSFLIDKTVISEEPLIAAPGGINPVFQRPSYPSGEDISRRKSLSANLLSSDIATIVSRYLNPGELPKEWALAVEPVGDGGDELVDSSNRSSAQWRPSVSFSELVRLYYHLSIYRRTFCSTKEVEDEVVDLVRQAGGRFRLRVVRENEPFESYVGSGGERLLFRALHPVEKADAVRIFGNRMTFELVTGGDIRHMMRSLGYRRTNQLLEIKTWLVSNFSLVDLEQFLFIGSLVLYANAVRYPNDFDLYVHHQPSVLSNGKNIQSYFRELLGEQFSPLPFVDIVLKDFGYWSPAAERNYLYNWPRSFGAANMDLVIAYPTNHFYFHGLKCVSLRGDLERRRRRVRPASYADIIGIKEVLGRGKDVDLPRLPRLTWIDNQWQELKEKDHFYRKIQRYIQQRYGTRISTEGICSMIERGEAVRPFDYPGDDLPMEIFEETSK